MTLAAAAAPTIGLTLRLRFLPLFLAFAAPFMLMQPASAMRRVRLKPLPAHLTAAQQASADAIRAEWPANLGDRAVQTGYCESTLNAHARNGQYKGLLQMGSRTHAKRLRQIHATNLYDPRTNARAAYDLYSRTGWRSWECR